MEEESKTEKTVKPKKSRYIKKGGNGGFRPGGGRKVHLKLKKQFNAREDLYWWIDAHWKKLTNYLEQRLEAGDNEIVKYLIDQRIGKATQAVSLDVSANVKVEHLESSFKNLLYGRDVNKTTEDSGALLQDGRGQANVIDGIAVQNIPADSSEDSSESLAVSSHPLWQISNSSFGSTDESK